MCTHVRSCLFICNSTPASERSFHFVCIIVVCVCASWEAGEVGGGNDDEPTLQGEIICHYPQFPDAAPCQWAELDLSHRQKKWSYSVDLLDHPKLPCPLPPLLLLPCFMASFFPPSLSLSDTCCQPYVLPPLCHLVWHLINNSCWKKFHMVKTKFISLSGVLLLKHTHLRINAVSRVKHEANWWHFKKKGNCC